MRPDFLVIGAAKSGTTALCQILAQHPDVFVCEPKEPHFMAFAGTTPEFRGPFDEEIINRRAITRWEDYEKLFEGGRGRRAVGEGSVSTLYYASASIPNIRRYAPEARLLCILRNPVERAYSAFMYLVSLTREPVADFATAWNLEPERIAQNYHHLWHYRRMGLYGEQLEPFLREFGGEQLKVMLYDDFRQDPAGVVRSCCEHLGIDPGWSFDFDRRPLVSGRPRNRLLQSVLGRPSRWKAALRALLPAETTRAVRDFISRRNLVREPMPPAMRKLLQDDYAEDIRKLEELLGRRLPWSG